MHSVNNGPVYKFASDQRVSNLEAYKAAGIPYARNHDAAFFNTYGGEHSVDISAVFPDFNADSSDEFAIYVKLPLFSVHLIEINTL